MSGYRKRMSRSHSRKSFKRGSTQKKINHARPGLRGGIRL